MPGPLTLEFASLPEHQARQGAEGAEGAVFSGHLAGAAHGRVLLTTARGALAQLGMGHGHFALEVRGLVEAGHLFVGECEASCLLCVCVCAYVCVRWVDRGRPMRTEVQSPAHTSLTKRPA